MDTLTMAYVWERSASLGRERVLIQALSREVIGGILERTTGEKLRQATPSSGSKTVENEPRTAV